MDGNGRWAQQRGRPRASGHQAGFKATREIVECCGRREIPALTLFAFSSENWNRPAAEVNRLMDLFLGALKSEVSKLNENNVRVQFVGERSAFSANLQREMTQAEQKTLNNTGLKLAIAVNYGGRWDIVEGCKRLASKVEAGVMNVDQITPEVFSNHISLPDCGEPDLFIRTGGEQRISNYLLWHLAYTELYFTDVLWPDFNDDELQKALHFFDSRERRFGRTGEQLKSATAPSAGDERA
ncbi:MAG: di-trans,poly-cis-decaprenylcistransferase [Gammaproteobacteria bacterium]|nr:di-trans,poly-cis-decaprenylcistransferase [Gammaproteobacteria bacterium]